MTEYGIPKGAGLQNTISVKGEVVSRDSESRPFASSGGDSRVTVGNQELDSETKVERDFKVGDYERPSTSHGRDSSEVAVKNKVVWGDPSHKGIVYGDKNLKGNVMNHIELSRDEYGTHGIRATGLKDGDNVHLISYNSEWMRENGLPTERIAKINKLEEVVVEGKVISIEEWKEKVKGDSEADRYRNGPLQKNKERLVKLRRLKENPITKLFVGKGEEKKMEDRLKVMGDHVKEEEEFEENREKFLDANFYVIERDLQVSERLSDMRDISKEKFEEMMAGIFKWVNVVMSTKGEGVIPGTEKVEDFNIEKEGDVERYFLTLGRSMGFYLSKFHNLGGIHGFPHEQNWSLVGTLYDLDSVSRSENISPEVIKKQHEDLEAILKRVFDFLSRNRQISRDVVSQMKSEFVSSYLANLQQENGDYSNIVRYLSSSIA
jgi:hypothetical protein